MADFGKNQILAMISVIIVLITGLAATPTVVDAVQDLNTTGWTFTGADGAISLIGLVPFIWVAMLLISSAVAMYAIAKGNQ